MTFIVHVNVVLIPFFTTFTSNSALGKENRLRMTPESFQLRSFMQDLMLGVVLISILLFSIDIFFRGNTVTKRSFNEFEVRHTQLWWSYIFSFNGLCDLVAVIAPFISLFAGKKDNRYGDMISYTNIMWQRELFSKMLFLTTMYHEIYILLVVVNLTYIYQLSHGPFFYFFGNTCSENVVQSYIYSLFHRYTLFSYFFWKQHTGIDSTICTIKKFNFNEYL